MRLPFIAVVCTAVLVLAIARGFVLLDFDGAFLFSVFALGSVSAFLGAVVAFAENKRAFGYIAAAFAPIPLFPIAFPRSFFADYSCMESMANVQRNIRALERDLHQEEDFASVDLVFMAPGGTKQKWVEATGTVDDSADFERLATRVEDLNFPVRYSVDVRRPSR